jgi:hypothetical protein
MALKFFRLNPMDVQSPDDSITEWLNFYGSP